jgi:hypothetical protein
MLDSSAKEFFNSQRLFREMIERFPGRYKNKKAESLKRLEDILKKLGGYILYISSMKMRNWDGTYNVRYEDEVLCVRVNECMLVVFREIDKEKKYLTDTELIGAFKNFFEC